MRLRQLVVVDAVDDGEVGAVGRRRDQDALGAGIEMRGAPFLEVKMPVHSSAMSMPSSFHGSCAGSLIAVTLIGAVADDDRVAFDRDFAGKRPCTLS